MPEAGAVAGEVLRAEGVRKHYGQTQALAGVDVSVRRGESVAIMGASGSGKTTLLHCLAGILVPDAGSVRLLGGDGPVEVTALDDDARTRLRRERFGFVFQQGLLVPELTAVENVALALMVNGVSRGRAVARARPWLDRLGLAGLEDRRIGRLSGGQAQRVAIARALVTGAELVFADEPTGALDSRTSAEMMQVLLEAMTAAGRTLVLVTHDAGVAAGCSRAVHMRDGLIEGAGGGVPMGHAP